MRLLLRGASVVDWHRLVFRDHADIVRFLRVNEFEPESASDMARLEDIRAEAVDYVSVQDAWLRSCESGTWCDVVPLMTHEESST